MKLKYRDIDNDEYEKMMKLNGNRARKGLSIRIKTPNQNSTLSPAGSLFKRRFSIKGFNLNDDQNRYNKDNKESNKQNITFKESSKSIKSYISSDLTKTDSELAIPEEYAYKDLENNVDVYDKNISMVRLNNEKTLDD